MPDKVTIVFGITPEGLDKLRNAADMLTQGEALARQSEILVRSAHNLLREIREFGEFSMLGNRVSIE